MLSIFIMYSKDRLEHLKYTISCLEDMPLYKESQKILVFDGKSDFVPNDWQAVQVPRINGEFCWGRMWDAGVFSSNNENIVYLDSDRLLPKNYLELINENIQDDLFIFSSMHFMMTQKQPIHICKSILSKTLEDLFDDDFAMTTLRYEVRHRDPYHGSGKNVMSGSTAFTKKTYKRIGGVDHWYCGHGAFADTDFHMQASINDCGFLDLGISELHLSHEKLNDKNDEIQDKDLWILSLDNFIYYCEKWKLPLSLVENMAKKCGISRPLSYIQDRLKNLRQSPRYVLK